jgi:hypothetical protein
MPSPFQTGTGGSEIGRAAKNVRTLNEQTTGGDESNADFAEASKAEYTFKPLPRMMFRLPDHRPANCPGLTAIGIYTSAAA